jgi:hypothetical protein
MDQQRLPARRRLLAALGATVAAPLAGCASAPPASGPTVPADGALRPWRTVQGGFLGPPAPLVGGPAQPATGAFVRLVFPLALAVRDNEMLIVDSGAARIYRFDLAFNALVPIAGAPATPQTRVALGADLSAFVLDVPARRVLRFARDGRLIQTFRADESLATPADFALTRTGSAVVIADRTLAQLVVIGMAGGTAVATRAMRSDRVAVGGAASIAAGRDDLYMLDVAAGVVHRVAVDGAIRSSFGQSTFTAPTIVAVDRFERVYVADPAAGRLHVFFDGMPVRAWTLAELGVQQLGGIAVDTDLLAVGDLGGGQVRLFRLPPPR